MIRILRNILFYILLAFTVNSFVYISFANIYSAKLLNYENFIEQYTNTVYQYRFLSVDLLVMLYHFLEQHALDVNMKLTFLDASAEKNMFLAYFILNSFFFMLTAMLLVFITESRHFIASRAEKILIIAAALLPVCISQFVLVPYDLSSYFFLLLFFWILLKYIEKPSTLQLLFLVIILIISTMNRESSALSISLAATLLYAKYGLTKKMIFPVAILTLSFVVVYASLRLYFGSFTTNDGNFFWLNISHPRGWIGILFWIVFFLFSVMTAVGEKQRILIYLFHILALPYLASCFYTGSLYEVRLYVPVFLTSLLIGRISINH